MKNLREWELVGDLLTVLPEGSHRVQTQLQVCPTPEIMLITPHLTGSHIDGFIHITSFKTWNKGNLNSFKSAYKGKIKLLSCGCLRSNNKLKNRDLSTCKGRMCQQRGKSQKTVEQKSKIFQNVSSIIHEHFSHYGEYY